MEPKGALIPPERIDRAIVLIRSQKVMLDWDLAALYGVETKNLIARFGAIWTAFLLILCFSCPRTSSTS